MRTRGEIGIASLSSEAHRYLDHPVGVVNHGDAEVILEPGGQGIVIAPEAGIAAGPGPGPGITGPTLLQAEAVEAETGGGTGTRSKDVPTAEEEKSQGPGKVQKTDKTNMIEKTEMNGTEEAKGANKGDKGGKREGEGSIEKGEQKPDDAGDAAAKLESRSSREQAKPVQEKVQVGPTVCNYISCL